MNGNDRWTAGWLGFTAWLMITIGGLNVVQGLIALIRGRYYVLAPDQIIVFDLTTWGWIMLIWGIILVLVGLSLLNGASWARWVTIVLVGINIFSQLGFLGNTNDTLWLLTALTLNIIVLYALIVRWNDSVPERA